MSYRGVARTLVLLLLAAVWALRPAKAAEPPPGGEAEVSAIRRLVTVYAESVDAADPTLAAAVWATTPEVSFIHPRGHERGWEAVKTNVYQKAMGETFSERKLTVKDVVVHAYGDAAWVEFYWDFAAKFRKDGSPLATHGRETQIYRKSDRRWSLVHVHYSAMPVTAERQGF